MTQGFNEIEGLHYFETFSPVEKNSTVLVLLALDSIHGWNLHKLDVNNVFLHRYLHEALYMKAPQGVIPPKPSQLCRLIKSPYMV